MVPQPLCYELLVVIIKFKLSREKKHCGTIFIENGIKGSMSESFQVLGELVASRSLFASFLQLTFKVCYVTSQKKKKWGKK